MHSLLFRLKTVMFATLGAALIGTAGQAQTTFVSNLIHVDNWTSAGWVGGTSGYQSAGSFTTGSVSQNIGSVSLAMRAASGTTSATFLVRLFSDSGGLPGTSLATFTGEANPATEGIYQYTLASTFTAAASTTYWIVASAPGQASNFDYFRWKVTNENTSNSDFGWVLGTQSAGSTDGGATFEAGTNEAIFAVGSAIPEPSTYALLAGLGALGLAAWRRKRGVGGA